MIMSASFPFLQAALFCSLQSVELVKKLNGSDCAELFMLYTHGGHSYDVSPGDVEAIRRTSEAERDAVVGFKAKLRDAGGEFWKRTTSNASISIRDAFITNFRKYFEHYTHRLSCDSQRSSQASTCPSARRALAARQLARILQSTSMA